jgi:hypothetical protein
MPAHFHLLLLTWIVTDRHIGHIAQIDKDNNAQMCNSVLFMGNTDTRYYQQKIKLYHVKLAVSYLEVGRRLIAAAARFRAWTSHMGFVVGKAALGQVFLEHFGFPCKVFYRLLHINHNHHPGLVQLTSSGLSKSTLFHSTRKEEYVKLRLCLTN